MQEPDQTAKKQQVKGEPWGRQGPPDPSQRANEPQGEPKDVDDTSVRAKSSGHGKKTADKWNQ